MTRVLVVEDEPGLARALAITLTARHYEVVTAATGAQALDAVAHVTPDLVVLDLGLPDMDGMDVLAALRGWTQVPVVVLSARQNSGDKVAALDAGADDYVTKPFGMAELLARLRAASRRAPGEPPPAVVDTASFTVDLVHRRVTRGDDEVRLTPTEWNLLAALARRPGQLVTREILLRELRGPHVAGEGHYLRVYLSQLRHKLEPDPSRPRHLVTEPGVGYRLQV